MQKNAANAHVCLIFITLQYPSQTPNKSMLISVNSLFIMVCSQWILSVSFFFVRRAYIHKPYLHWSSMCFLILCDNRQLYNYEIWSQLIICWSSASCKVSVQGPSTKCNMEKWLQIHSTSSHVFFFCFFFALGFANCRLFPALSWQRTLQFVQVVWMKIRV